jgi:hypothetical protein
MNTGDMEFWEWASAKLRRVHRHREMTPEEMEAFLDTVEDEPLPENQIEEIVASIRAGLIPHQEPAPDFSWLGVNRDTEVEEDIYQLARNKGQDDEETLRRIEELRLRELEDDGESTDRLADGTEPTGEGH